MAESNPSSSPQTGRGRPPTAFPLFVSVRTFGCKVNRVESERIAAELLGARIELAEEDRAAVIVVNTCAVTGEAEAKARKAVRHAAALPHHPVVVVTGCVSAIAADQLRALAEGVIVENDKSLVPTRVLELLDMPAQTTTAPVRIGKPFRTRSMVKIEDGCDAFCAYCIVPYARGVPTSVPLIEIVAEVRALVDAGVPEVVLTGINTGRYDHDGTDFVNVIEAVAATGVERIRLSSVEPQDLTDRVLDTMASTPAFLPHLHVPLQSGSNDILRAMKRAYTVSEFEDRINAARARLPGLAVTTDVIAGFPTETDQAAEETRLTCERIGFSKLHVFRYSMRAGTAAADMEQLPPRSIAARAKVLRTTGAMLSAAYADSRLGQHASVLIERVTKDAGEGTTGDYLKVVVQSAGLSVGKPVKVLLGRREGAILVANPL